MKNKKNDERPENQLGLFSVEEKKVTRGRKKKEILNQEEEDISLRDFDINIGEEIIGVDEAGRGPLAGAVVAAAVKIKDYNSDMLYEPDVNIHIGCWYLDKLIDQFGDENTAVAAYNAGSGNVSKWLMEEKHSSDGVSLDLIPFQETEKYVKKVEMTKKIYNYLYNN